MLAYAFYEVDTRIMQYANALVERGDTVDVLALGREGHPKFEIINVVNVYRVQSRQVNERGQFSYLFRILRFLFSSGILAAKKHLAKPYDVVHVHSVPDFLVFAALVPKLSGASVILDIHDIMPELYASKFGMSPRSVLFRLLLFAEKLSIAFSDHVIIANHLWKERLVARSVERQKCTPIVNYPDPLLFHKVPKETSGDRFTILYPGTLNRHQGVDIAIRAFSKVADQMHGAEFHIYGEGPDKLELISLVQQLHMESRVIFHDFVPTAEVAKVMARADLAIVPKRASSTFGNEAISTKIMEFMSVGVPLIVSRTKIDSYYHDDSMVQFYESENESDLAAAMLQLWQSPDLRKRLTAGADRYIGSHTWTVKKLEYLDIVDRLCA